MAVAGRKRERDFQDRLTNSLAQFFTKVIKRHEINLAKKTTKTSQIDYLIHGSINIIAAYIIVVYITTKDFQDAVCSK